MQESPSTSPVQTRKAKEPSTDSGKDGLAYNCLLKNELLSAGIEDLKVMNNCYQRKHTRKKAEFCLQKVIAHLYIIILHSKQPDLAPRL